jgi:hypothetical protein
VETTCGEALGKALGTMDDFVVARSGRFRERDAGSLQLVPLIVPL